MGYMLKEFLAGFYGAVHEPNPLGTSRDMGAMDAGTTTCHLRNGYQCIKALPQFQHYENRRVLSRSTRLARSSKDPHIFSDNGKSLALSICSPTLHAQLLSDSPCGIADCTMNTDPAKLRQLVLTANRMRANKYLDVASLSLLVVDYLATLDLEIKHMWPAPWSLAKALFFLSRYLVFFDVPFAIYYHTTLGLEPEACQAMFRVGTTSIVSGVVIAEAILFLRVYALSGRNQKLMIGLMVQFAVTHLAWIGMYGKFLALLEFGPSPIPSVFGCFPLPPTSPLPNALLAGIFGFIMANEMSIVLMTFVIGLIKYRSLRGSPLIGIFYRDGLIYFAVLSAFSVANMIVDLVGPPEFRFLMVIFQRTVHSLLSCRMILSMRTYSAGESDMTAFLSSRQGMQFAANPRVRSVPRTGGLSSWDIRIHSHGVATSEAFELSLTKPTNS